VCVWGWGGDDVRGCYDPVLVVGLNGQNEIRALFLTSISL